MLYITFFLNLTWKPFIFKISLDKTGKILYLLNLYIFQIHIGIFDLDLDEYKTLIFNWSSPYARNYY